MILCVSYVPQNLRGAVLSDLCPTMRCRLLIAYIAFSKHHVHLCVCACL